MRRSTTRRQSDSARTYLDFAALSPALDAAAHLAADALGFPISMINIIDRDSQYTLAQYGFATQAGAVVPRAHAVCSGTVDAAAIVVVENARPSTADTIDSSTGAVDGTDSIKKLILAAGLVAYAGIPLIGREGMAIGTLCVFDTEPHPVTDTHRHLLTLSANVVQEHLEAHRNRTHAPMNTADAARFAEALSSGQITPWYQPVVDLPSGRIVAVEALARWNHPTRGLLTPDRFLEVTESSELIIDLDLAVLSQGLLDLKTWLPDDDALRLHVNLSGAHFVHPDCVGRILGAVRETGCSPESVVLEITESAAFAASPANIEFVAELRRAGFGVVLDDLGAGWSGVDRLLELPLSGFKVDKAVTDRLGTRAGDAIMRALHSLALDLDLDLTVEGVETAEQARAVAALGSVRGQGYWWARPSPAPNIGTLVGRIISPTGHLHTVPEPAGTGTTSAPRHDRSSGHDDDGSTQVEERRR